MATYVEAAAIVGLVAVVTIVGFYALAAYIVRHTKRTEGIADIGRAVAEIVTAITGRRRP
ncbi:hypothetical protein A5719_10710 [Mycolicibacterium peregrinum]|uniref:hypothetical protein n=1 Tax=Mycolicibacterium peregrinum TaxID=43304 RepID=UPI0007EB5A32|nr:hypothetical protein [Mycolicibacterium peregrinum]OBF41850.1 hypothetical protein A5719_10710 [Mycolicibacterium peregrinum]